MFKYSINHGIYGKEPLEASIKRIACSGYDGVELVGEPYILKAEIVRDLLKAYEIKASSVCGIYTLDRDLSNVDPSVRMNAVCYVKDCIIFASKIGAQIVIVVPSSVGKMTPSTRLDQEWHLARESIYEAGQFAKGLGVYLAIEALNRYETYLINKISQALKLRDEVDLENVGVMIDSFHMNIEERSIPETIKKAASHLIHVHIADSNREAAGFGHIDMRSLLQALIKIKYKGYIAMEFVPPKSEYCIEGYPVIENETLDLHTNQSINYLKKLYQDVHDIKNL